MKKVKLVFGASTVVLIIALALLANALITSAFQTQSQYTVTVTTTAEVEERGTLLTVTGYGSVTYSPDQATVSFNIIGSGETAEEAMAECGSKAETVIDALRALGISDEDMATTQISLSPRYDWNYKPPKIVGYEASYTLRVKVRELEKLGKVIDAAVEAGADSIWGISFTLSPNELNELRFEAIKAAVDDAKTKAEAAAEALGMTIVGVKSINLSPSLTPFREYKTVVAEVGAAPPIIPGEGEVTATVSITYLLA